MQFYIEPLVPEGCPSQDLMYSLVHQVLRRTASWDQQFTSKLHIKFWKMRVFLDNPLYYIYIYTSGVFGGPVRGSFKKHPYNAPIAQWVKMSSGDHFTDISRFFLWCRHLGLENSSPRLLSDFGSPALLRMMCFSARQRAQNLSPGLWAGTEAIANHLMETSAPF